MSFNYKLLFLLLILPFFCSFKIPPPPQEEDLLGLWVIDKVHCLGGKVISLGMESEMTIDQMSEYQDQIEERYFTQTTYEFKDDGTFIAKAQITEDDNYSWIGKWEFIDASRIKLVGFSSICEDCNQFFEIIDFSNSQMSLTNQFATDTENNLFSLSKAVIKFAVVLVK
jgi:hypothetical protein